jgi:hypothetical protein
MFRKEYGSRKTSLTGAFCSQNMNMVSKIINSKISAILVGLIFVIVNTNLTSFDSFQISLGIMVSILVPATVVMLAVINKVHSSFVGKITILFTIALAGQILSWIGLSIVNLMALLISIVLLLIFVFSGSPVNKGEKNGNKN